MSYQYDQYLTRHKFNVMAAFVFLKNNFPELITDEYDYEWQITLSHDGSKTKSDEYEAYDAYFYGGNRSFKVVQEFNKAWLLHIHRNEHHWQHWVLINDDPEEDVIAIEMPYNYVIEMICDWWSFSWGSADLSSIFKWYDERKNYIVFHDKTRALVENILLKIKNKLEADADEKKIESLVIVPVVQQIRLVLK